MSKIVILYRVNHDNQIFENIAGKYFAEQSSVLTIKLIQTLLENISSDNMMHVF